MNKSIIIDPWEEFLSESVSGRSNIFSFRRLGISILILGGFYLSLVGIVSLGQNFPVTSYRIHKHDNAYGPHLGIMTANLLNYSNVQKTFGGYDPIRFEDYEYAKLESMILNVIPKRMRSSASNFIRPAFAMSEKYQVDPFWVLAVMYTESHFNPAALSSVKAMGLMQIMPGTSHFLTILLNRPVKPQIAYEMAKRPNHNIEMGVFYLKHLFSKFSGNFRLATVAYNMGPGMVRRRLRLRLPVGVRNNYLDKVTKRYWQLSAPFRKSLVKNPAISETSYVVSHRKIQAQKDLEFLMVFNPVGIDIDIDVASSRIIDSNPFSKSVLL